MNGAAVLRDRIEPLKSLGLGLCRGDVLDVGAGTHTFELERRGFAVTVVDFTDIGQFVGGPFDTVIDLDHGFDNGTHYLARLRAY